MTESASPIIPERIKMARARGIVGLDADSDRGTFNFAWPLADIRAFAAPIPMRGAQGFWNWPEAVVKVEHQLRQNIRERKARAA